MSVMPYFLLSVFLFKAQNIDDCNLKYGCPGDSTSDRYILLLKGRRKTLFFDGLSKTSVSSAS